MGASPDSVVVCDCCGEGCVEIKCPYCNEDQFIFETLDERNTCLTKSGNEIQLNRNHGYFYQIQCQMFVAEKKYCDFYLWTEKDWHIERILPNKSFWDDTLSKSREFFQLCILPELVGKFYTVDIAPATADENIDRNIHNTNESVITYCYCKQSECGGEMIACDNQKCVTEWFHIDCLKL